MPTIGGRSSGKSALAPPCPSSSSRPAGTRSGSWGSLRPTSMGQHPYPASPPNADRWPPAPARAGLTPQLAPTPSPPPPRRAPHGTANSTPLMHQEVVGRARLPPRMPTKITVMADSDGSPQRDDPPPPPVPLPLPRLPGVDGGNLRGARGAEAGGGGGAGRAAAASPGA